MDAERPIDFVPAKISGPRNSRAVARPRLFERIDDLEPVPITWICAPPGSGKTMLVASYLAARGLNEVWVQLDSGDADVATFFYYLGLSVQRANRHGHRVLPSLAPEFLAGLNSFTGRYAEAISACLTLPAVIVLDNYEEVPLQTVLPVRRQEAAAHGKRWCASAGGTGGAGGAAGAR